MIMNRWVGGVAALAAAGVAWAGPGVPLGTPVGITVGATLGQVVGFVVGGPLGSSVGGVLSIGGGGLLLLGVWIIYRVARGWFALRDRKPMYV